MPLMQLLFGFNGRIRRSQYWLASIAVAVVSIAAFIPYFMVARLEYTEGSEVGIDSSNPTQMLGLALIFVVYILDIWIGLALQIKRWHDRDKSGLWVFIALVPLIGGIWVLVECGFLDGTPGPNRFGPSPKGIGGPGVSPGMVR
jgi:uncharacterized membrane protein YhaH (DUF805 family)